MIYFIYKITNNVNNKIYIGYTKNPISRWKSHKNSAKKCDSNTRSKLYRAMKKYGIENFQFSIIYQSTDKHHCKEYMEPHFIAQFNSIEEGYNITKGGSGGATRNGRLWTEEEKLRISIGTKLAMTSEVRKNISDKRAGMKATEKTKKILSDSHKHLRWVSHLEMKQSKFVSESEANSLLQNGWIKGRKFNNSWVNSGTNFRTRT